MPKQIDIDEVVATIEQEVKQHTLREEIAQTLQDRFQFSASAARKLAKTGQYAIAYGGQPGNLRSVVQRNIN